MGANPSILIRVAANVEELRKNLKEGRDSIEVTTAGMSKLVNSFTGEKMVQHARNVVAAIDQVGVHALSAAEAGRQLDTLDRAMDKLMRTSQQVPQGMMATAAELRRVVKASEDGAEPAERLSATYQKFDGVLQAIGINIGPHVKGVEDIAGAAGKSVAQVGALGAAGLVLGAGMAGWGVGRAIANFFGLDEKIAGATARLMGYGNLAAEVGGAKQDVINRAIAKGAKENITYAEATVFLQKAVEKAASSQETWAANVTAAKKKVEGLTDAQLKQIQNDRDLGASQEQLLNWYGLTAQAIKVIDEVMKKKGENEKKLAETAKQLAREQIADHDRVTKAIEQNAKRVGGLDAEIEQLRTVRSGTRLDTTLKSIDREFAAEVGKLSKLDPLYMQHYNKLAQVRDEKKQNEMAGYAEVNEHSRSALEQRAAREQATLQHMQLMHGQFGAAAIQNQKDIALAARDAAANFRDAHVSAIDTVLKKQEELAAKEKAAAEKKTEEAAKAKAEREKPISTTIQRLTTAEIKALSGNESRNAMEGHDGSINLWNKLKDLEAREGTVAPKDNRQYRALMAESALLEQLRMWAQGQQRPPGFKDGVTDFAGGLAYVHRDELLVNMPKGTDVIPRDQATGAPAASGGVTLNVSMTFRGSVITTSGAEFEQRVGDALLNGLRRSGVALPMR